MATNVVAVGGYQRPHKTEKQKFTTPKTVQICNKQQPETSAVVGPSHSQHIAYPGFYTHIFSDDLPFAAMVLLMPWTILAVLPSKMSLSA